MNGSKLFIPISIVVAGLIIAGAVMFSGDKEGGRNPVNNGDDTAAQADAAVNPVSDADHIMGSPDAEVIVVEYSDFECPFCARFHPTMEQIMSEYGESGKVAWVYRHFPLDQIHKDARPSAEASECVAELNGNDAFWEYMGKLFENTPESLSTENLIANAIAVGVDEAAFNECVESGRHADTVDAMYQDGLGAAEADPQFGTPYSIVMKKDGTQVVIPGAQPYSVVKQVIDSLLAE